MSYTHKAAPSLSRLEALTIFSLTSPLFTMLPTKTAANALNCQAELQIEISHSDFWVQIQLLPLENLVPGTQPAQQQQPPAAPPAAGDTRLPAAMA